MSDGGSETSSHHCYTFKEPNNVADVRSTRTGIIWASGLAEFCVIVKEKEKVNVVKNDVARSFRILWVVIY